MDAKFKSLMVFFVVVTGCHHGKLLQRGTTPIAAPQSTTSVQAMIYPGSPVLVQIPQQQATLREVVAQARDMKADEEVLRYFSHDKAHFGLSEDSSDMLPLSRTGEDFVVVIYGTNRVFIPSVLVSESLLGRYPVNSKTSVIVLPQGKILDSKFWDETNANAKSITYINQGNQDVVSMNGANPNLQDSFGNLSDAFKQSAKSGKPNVAVIRRELNGYSDQIVIPLLDVEFEAAAFTNIKMTDNMLLLDGDVVELSRFETLPIVAVALMPIK